VVVEGRNKRLHRALYVALPFTIRTASAKTQLPIASWSNDAISATSHLLQRGPMFEKSAADSHRERALELKVKVDDVYTELTEGEDDDMAED
jgi:hypothetical protein